ncbi:40S ribosomal protein S20 [Mitosporidium daphniae]|uniref:Small ribosomal subunit protein uS10 n=1 Tax=Mitosporidium daphniae TaxID=1485682 RepID=A0A098VSF0_9MICR|nr:40S ribosomal protein S20 [Mitosporidium daphniae]KGG52008.1 40S ribosomal protein S20 [Mitosporidium daphniae]|eukprot:XP_013238444.1 40S ribosomal protein S20 [Mitosporidium daphniae]
MSSAIVMTPPPSSLKAGTSTKPGFEHIITPKIHRIRITLSSRNVKAIETVCSRITTAGKAKNVGIKGPVRMPTKVLRITTRKTPCGEGSKTWDRYELRIYKRVIDLNATAEQVKEITNVQIEAGVDVEITISDN